MQCFDWNAVNLGSDCVIEGSLQLHTFENMMLKVKQTHIQDGCTVNLGATVMGGASLTRYNAAAVDPGAKGNEHTSGL